MAALVTIEELEAALATTFEDGSPEEAQAQYYIDTISAFINSYVDVSFEKHTDETVRYRADYYGTVTLAGPVDSVAGVVRPNSTYVVPFLFDDFDKVYNLQPSVAYDITYTWGYDEVPMDIKGVVIEAVRASINNPNNSLSFRVGDVTETYLSGQGVNNQSPIVVLSAAVLDNYSDLSITLTLGSILPQPPNAWNC